MSVADEQAASGLVRLAAAYHFAAVQHVDQRRKGERAEPYINHLTEVAELVARVTGGADPDVILAAVLHDVVEDTAVGLAEVAARFGPEIAALVAEAADDKGAAESRPQTPPGGACSLRLDPREAYQAGGQDG